MGHHLRPPTIDDADDLGAVHLGAWEAAYRGGLMPDEYLDELTVEDRAEWWRQSLATEPMPRATRLVAETEDGAVVGFIAAGPEAGDPDTDVGEVYGINVDPAHWDGGVGSDLLDAGTRHLAAAGFDHAILWVHPDNHRTLAFYAARGWTDTGVRRDQEVIGVEVPEARYRRPLP